MHLGIKVKVLFYLQVLAKVLQGSLVSISWSFALVVVGSVDVCEVCFIVHFSDLPIGNFMSPVLVLANKNSLLMASASAHRLRAAVICWWVSMVELIGLWRWSCLVDRSIELMADGSRIFRTLSRCTFFRLSDFVSPCDDFYPLYGHSPLYHWWWEYWPAGCLPQFS